MLHVKLTLHYVLFVAWTAHAVDANSWEADALHVQIVQRIKDTVILQKLAFKFHKAPPKWEFKEYYGFFLQDFVHWSRESVT